MIASTRTTTIAPFPGDNWTGGGTASGGRIPRWANGPGPLRGLIGAAATRKEARA